MKKNTDLRIVKTQKAIYNALLELMKDKSFESIKVSDICATALVNRSTFYAHYEDKYELLVDFVDTLKSALAETLEQNENIFNTREYYIEMIRLLLEHMEDKKDVYYSMLLNNRGSITSDITIDTLSKDIKKRLQKEPKVKSNVPSEIISVFYLGAVAGVVIKWLMSPKDYTKQEIIDYLDVLIPEDIV